MGWQAPSYIYPQIEVPDYNKLTEGVAKGIAIGAQIGGAVDAKALENEVSTIATDAQTKIDALGTQPAPDSTAVAMPDQSVGIKAGMEQATGYDPKIAAMMGAQQPTVSPIANQIVPDKTLAMAGGKTFDTSIAPKSPDLAATEKMALENAAPREQSDIQTKRMEINADMHNKIIQAHYKHGDVKGAQELEDKFFDQTLKVASIDHKSGQKIWNNSFLKDKYGDIDLKPKDNFTVVGDHGNYIKYNKTTGDVTPIQSVGELKDMDPNRDVYMKTTDESGKVTWQQVKLGKPKEENAQVHVIGDKLYERDKSGNWVEKAYNPKDGDGASKKTSMQMFDDVFVQNYSAGFVDEAGKAPDVNTVMAKFGKSEVKGKLDNKGKPITLQQLHETMQQHYEQQIKDGTNPAEALNNTLRFGQDFGVKGKVDIKIPRESSDAVQASMIKHKAAGAKILMNQTTGAITADYGNGKTETVWDGKAMLPGKQAPAPAAKPPVVKTTPAAKPAAAPVVKTGRPSLDDALKAEKKVDNSGDVEAAARRAKAVELAQKVGGVIVDKAKKNLAENFKKTTGSVDEQFAALVASGKTSEQALTILRGKYPMNKRLNP